MASFDWDLTIKLCNNRQDVAEELTNMLIIDLPRAQQAINAAAKSQDTNKVYDEIHKLHGSCAYCGMPKLKELICHLEDDIKNHKSFDLCQPVEAINNEIELVKRDLAALKKSKG